MRARLFGGMFARLLAGMLAWPVVFAGMFAWPMARARCARRCRQPSYHVAELAQN